MQSLNKVTTGGDAWFLNHSKGNTLNAWQVKETKRGARTFAERFRSVETRRKKKRDIVLGRRVFLDEATPKESNEGENQRKWSKGGGPPKVLYLRFDSFLSVAKNKAESNKRLGGGEGESRWKKGAEMFLVEILGVCPPGWFKS